MELRLKLRVQAIIMMFATLLLGFCLSMNTDNELLNKVFKLFYVVYVLCLVSFAIQFLIYMKSSERKINDLLKYCFKYQIPVDRIEKSEDGSLIAFYQNEPVLKEGDYRYDK